MNIDNPLTKYRIGLVADALAAGPLSVHQLAPKIFLCYAQAWRLLKGMHEQRLAHVAKWVVHSTPRETRVAAYAMGPGKDVPKPKRLKPQQRQARYKARIRADADRLDVFLAKNRARKRKPARDPLITAMFGAPAARATTEGVSHV